MLVSDTWTFSAFLDEQERFLLSSGASHWLMNHLMIDTLAVFGRMR